MIRQTRPMRLSITRAKGANTVLPLSRAFSLSLTFSLAAFWLTISSTAFVNIAYADEPVLSDNTTISTEELQQLVSEEQRELAEMKREELETLAANGERLAQVALGADFADEAQQVLFSPDAANAALSDALAWYSLAAQRGLPGTRSLNDSGVKFHPVRVVRNK